MRQEREGEHRIVPNFKLQLRLVCAQRGQSGQVELADHDVRQDAKRVDIEGHPAQRIDHGVRRVGGKVLG
jgi:hypothetical protein